MPEILFAALGGYCFAAVVDVFYQLRKLDFWWAMASFVCFCGAVISKNNWLG